MTRLDYDALSEFCSCVISLGKFWKTIQVRESTQIQTVTYWGEEQQQQSFPLMRHIRFDICV